MARPERNNVDYFPFICEDGNKMFYIEETYGNDGFATFVKILRELAKTNYHYLDLSKRSTLMFLSAKCKVSVEILERIIIDLVELGKFDSELWKENKIIWCQDLIDSIQDAYSKRNSKCMNKPNLLLLLSSLGVRKPSKQPSKGVINTQSIVEDIIVEESKVKHIPSVEEFLNYSESVLKENFELYKFSLETKYKAWVENDWKDGNGKEIKIWKTKLLNTIPFLKKENVAPKEKSKIQETLEMAASSRLKIESMFGGQT